MMGIVAREGDDVRVESDHKESAQGRPLLVRETEFVASDSARISMLAVASAAAGVVFGFLLAALALAPSRCEYMPRGVVVVGAPQAAQVTYLGVEVRSAKGPHVSGARVVSVLAGSPAEAAGIVAGDLITGFDGYRVDGAQDLVREVRSHRPGDWVLVRIEKAAGEDVVLHAVLHSIALDRLERASRR